MKPFDEVQELEDMLGSAKSAASIQLSRSKQLHALHPEAGNELYIEIDAHNVGVINDMIDLFADIKHYPN